jgi:hypothetical protein
MGASARLTPFGLQMWSDNYITPPSKGGWNNWGNAEPANNGAVGWADGLVWANPGASKPGKWYVGNMYADNYGLTCGGGSYYAVWKHVVCRQRREWRSGRVRRLEVLYSPCAAALHQGCAPPAGPLSFYTPQYMSVVKSGCQPANSSYALSFNGDWWMYRVKWNNWNWMDHVAAAKSLGGYLWAPYTRKEQVRGCCCGTGRDSACSFAPLAADL